MRLSLLIILTILAETTKSSACSCIGEYSVKENIKVADLVAVGSIINREIVAILDSEQIELFKPDSSQYKRPPYTVKIAKYELVIGELYKGEIATDTISVYTGLGGGDCGFEFIVGDKYIIYGNKETYFGGTYNYPKGQNIYWTYICTRTQAFNDKELNEIKKIKK